MKKLIVTRADDNIKEMYNITHPILKKYAERCGATFDIIKDNIEGLHPHWRILSIDNLFDIYDRIAVIDSDTIVLKSCPNIFDEVPVDCIGSVLEDKGSRLMDRRERIRRASNRYGNVDWSDEYINTGVFILSKEHRKILEYTKENLWNDLGFDDVYFGWRIKSFGYKLKELSYKWNHMSMFSEDWNGNPSRFDSYIIHYAGNGFPPYVLKRTEQIKQDFNLLKKYKLVEV